VSESEFWKSCLALARVQFYNDTLVLYLNAYCEEGVGALLEVRASLTIVHKDLTLIDDRHLSEALLGVK
jgi:hypothetical protein